MRASTIDDNAAWADLGASVVPFIYMGILNQYVESVKHDREVQKAAMKFNEILQNERKEAEELAAQEKERADRAEDRLKELEKELAELKSGRCM